MHLGLWPDKPGDDEGYEGDSAEDCSYLCGFEHDPGEQVEVERECDGEGEEADRDEQRGALDELVGDAVGLGDAVVRGRGDEQQDAGQSECRGGEVDVLFEFGQL